MSTANLSLVLANLETEAAQLQYLVDCESEYHSRRELDRMEKRLAYLCKLIDKTERQMLADTAH